MHKRLSEAESRRRRELKSDLCDYARTCLRIRAKSGAIKRLRYNAAQRIVHNTIEEQKHETGRVRVLVLKGRQQGVSTYVQSRFYHRVTHEKGHRAFILTHEDEATRSIFMMADRFYKNTPVLVRPTADRSNQRELYFGGLDSGYAVATARTKAAGRSQTVQLFHGSEVAYWPNAESHVAGVMQAVPSGPGSEVILESTSSGASGLFYRMCQKARQGKGEYRLIFVPWYMQPEYTVDSPDFEPLSEELDAAVQYGLTNEQLAWRRLKLEEFGTVHQFRREYPSNIDEAFAVDAPGALWERELFDRTRAQTAPPLVRIVVAVDPQSKTNSKSSCTGIAVCGIAKGGEVYVLADESIGGKPEVCAARARSCLRSWKADCVVYESNQGGDMVASALVAAGVRKEEIRSVTASKGKQARAEPVSIMFEQGRCHVVGSLPALEDQCCTWEPLTGQESPDRLDAMVWGVAHLTQHKTAMVAPVPGLTGKSRNRI